MNNIIFEENIIRITNVQNFDLEQTFNCGQAFRWHQKSNGHWIGCADKKCLEIYNDGCDICIQGTNRDTFLNFWANYFDLGRNYGEIIDSFSKNPTLKAAAETGSGIRILNQEPWETLCSFIISQNNNIPRIKGIIERLCENFGEKCGEFYSFPSAQTIARLTLDDLAVLRSGFRAKYILDAAKKVAGGEIVLDALKAVTFEEAQLQLMKIKGVGPKVADCVLLFSLGHIDAFPKDVWIKRALSELFGGEMPPEALSAAGIAQQYIFYYIRKKQS